MAVTTTPRFGITRWSAGTDPFTRVQMDDSHSAIESKGAIYLQGTAATRPSAGTVGRFYYATDTTAFFYDDGTAWRNVSDPDTVLLNATQTLTNKTLTAPVINGTVTGSSTLTGVNSISTPDFVQFDLSHTATSGVGKVMWNSTEGTLEYQLVGGNIAHRIGQDLVARVRNNTGGTLAKGSVVYVSGANGDRKQVALASAANESQSTKVIGVLAEAITDGNEGFCMVTGVVKGLNTSSYTVGTGLWLSDTTPGAFTATRPVAPSHGVFVGWVTRVHANNGEIWVNVQNGYELDELHDVKITTPANGQILRYNSTGGYWENKDFSSDPINNPTFTGTVVLPSTTSIGDVSSTEISYLDGVTSAIQTQLNAKQPLDADLTAIAALAGTSGLLKKTAADTWTLDTVAYAPLASPTFTGTVTLPGTVAGNVAVTGTWSTSGSGKFSGLGAITIVTSSTRPGSPAGGQVIYETDTTKFFGWNGTTWAPIGGGAVYQTTAPSAPLVGDIWIDSDEAATFLNQNDYLTKIEAGTTYATITDLGNAGYSPFLLMGA